MHAGARVITGRDPVVVVDEKDSIGGNANQMCHIMFDGLARNAEPQQETAERVRELEGGDESFRESPPFRSLAVDLGTGSVRTLRRPAARLPHAPPRA